MLAQTLVLILIALMNLAQDERPTASCISTIARGDTPVCEVLEWRRGSEVAQQLVLANAGVQDSDPSAADQTLTTTVHDPTNPDEPWIVTTHRRRSESQSAFIKRHREMVAAVRSALDPSH